MTVSRADLTELADKYAALLRLRHAGKTPTAADSRAHTKEMARLASAFPGALRELDDSPIDLLEARHAALTGCKSAAAKPQTSGCKSAAAKPQTSGAHAHETGRENEVHPWMVACVSFHRFARGALSVKRWLRGKKNIDEATRAEFVGTVARLPFAEDAALWKNDLRALANPPRGRISQLVFEHVGRAMGVSALEVRLLVFGPNRRERVNRC